MASGSSFLVAAAAVLVACAALAGCGVEGPSGSALLISRASASPPPERLVRVPSGSMEPTYRIGDRVIVGPAPPRIGAVVVFHPPQGAEREQCGPKPHLVRLGGAACDSPIPRDVNGVDFIKRVVAGPGDVIEIRAGHVLRRAHGQRRFVREPDSYIRRCGDSSECSFPTPIKIPPGHWFLMGDNRGESDDSRFWGPVPSAWITGTVTGVLARSEPNATEGSQIEGGFTIERVKPT